MSADPEAMVTYMGKLDAHMGKFNTVVSGLTRVIDKNIRAQTKVIAMASKTKGMMLGVVADLELMGGAFGKMKKALANIFLPVTANTPKIFKYGQSLMTLSGAYKHLISPMTKLIMKSKERVSALNKELAAENKAKATDKASISGMSKMNKRFNLFSRLTGGTKTLKAYPRHQIAGLGGVDEKTGLSDMPTDTVISSGPAQGKAPSALMGLEPLQDIAKPGAFKQLRELGSSKMKSGMKMWKKNVTNPIKQIASGGIGLGFQTTIIMGLMQAFSNLFTIFQPVIDVVGMLVERISVGFMPLIEFLMEILTSPPVLAMVDMLAQVLAEVFEMFRPLVPVIIDLIHMAMLPLFKILEGIMPIIKIIAQLFGTLLIAFMPLIDMMLGVLGPVIEWLVKVLLLLIVIGMYPLVMAIYAVGLGIAALIDLFTLGAAGAINDWNNLMLPIFGALNVATGAVIDTFHSGTDYVPQTGIYYLEKGESVQTVEENRFGSRGGQNITINIDGGIWVQDLDEFVSMVGRKLSLYRG